MEQFASFGAWVRRRRKALDLTQVVLAQRVGVAAVTIQKIEADERRPSMQVAALLAEQLQIAANEQAAFLATARGERAPDRLGEPNADLATGPGRLPARLSSFVGRAREQQELATLLAQPDVRLITLTGTGGIGKTSLAVQVAQSVAPAYQDGAVFVDLSPICVATDVAFALLRALGIPEVAGVPAEAQLIGWLRERRLLLVVDNMEQVVEAAPLLTDIVRGAPGVQVLVTSRVPLRVSGEQEFLVEPLEIAAEGAPHEQLMASDALALFYARARQIRPELGVGTADTIRIICEHLDGLPLAIELAAARLRLFTPAQLLQQLQEARLEFLVGGARDLPVRQQTLRATLDWSYALLPQDAQTLLARLSVFAGGWTLEAALEVCGQGLDTLHALEQLAEHHLVQLTSLETGRARMLETVRAYASERLQERGEEAQLRLRHATYLAELAERSEPALYGPQAPGVLLHLRAELENIRTALAWTIEQQPELAGRLCAALCEFWWCTTFRIEGEEWTRQALGLRERLSIPVRARLAMVAAAMGIDAAASATVDELFQEAAGMFERLDDRANQALTLCYYARYLHTTDQHARSDALLDVCESILPQLEAPRILSWWHFWRGFNAFHCGDSTLARHHWELSLGIVRQIGYIRGQAQCELALAELDYHRGDIAASRRRNWYRLALEQSIDNQTGVASTLDFLGCLALAQAHLDEAASHFEAALRLLPPTQQFYYYTWLCYIAGLCSDAESAERVWLRAWPAGQIEQEQRGLLIQLTCAAAMQLAQGRLDTAAQLAAFVEEHRSHELTLIWHAGPDRDPWFRLLRDQLHERLDGSQQEWRVGSSLTWEAATKMLEHCLSVQPHPSC